MAKYLERNYEVLIRKCWPDLSMARMIIKLHQAKNKRKRTPCFTLQTASNKLEGWGVSISSLT